MKLHKLYFSFLFLLVTTIFYAQNGIAYQAVIFKPGVKTLPGVSASSTPLVNTKVCLRFTFIDISDKSEYQETVTVTTDDYGIVNTTIGLGNQIGGYAKNFSEVSWRTEQKTLVVELDLTANCSTYEEISRQSFSSTPFAFTANNISGIASIANGGTGASTAAEALDNLGAQRVSNLSTDINGDGTSIVKYPAVKTVKEYVDAKMATSGSNATTTATGKIQLAGDLAGVGSLATSPVISNLAITATKLAPDAVETAKIKDSNVTSVKIADGAITDSKIATGISASKVGLDNVDNTSDVNKPLSTATTLQLAIKEDLSNKVTDFTANSTSDTKYPSVKAIKTYVDSKIAGVTTNGTVDADSTTKGLIQLAGDFSGTADAPTVTNAAVIGKQLTGFTSSAGAILATDTVLGALQKVDGNVALKAPLDSPVFTGIPVAPTANANTISEQLATTAFVSNAVANANSAGLLPPSMSTAERDAISNPAKGLQIYCTDCSPEGLYSYNGTAWTSISVIDTFPTDIVVNGITVGRGSGSTGQFNTALGYTSLIYNTTGESNTALGDKTLRNNTIGSNNSAIGNLALATNIEGNNNTALGSKSLFSNIDGNNNTAIGIETLKANTMGYNNTALGAQSLYSNTEGNNNTAIGIETLKANTTGFSNTALGAQSLYSNTEGNNNTAIGIGTLKANTTGNNNTALGAQSLSSNIDGSNDTAIGTATLNANTTGSYNSAIGTDALSHNTTGSYNTALGAASLSSNTEGNNNTALGYSTLRFNTTGSYNTAMGMESLKFNTTGSSNTALGYSSLQANSEGYSNTALGYGSLLSNVNGSDNIALGVSSLNTNTTGANNIAVGNFSLFSNTEGISNTAIGRFSLYSTTGTNNTALGAQSLYDNVAGNSNISLGFKSGLGLTTGDKNIFIGSQTTGTGMTTGYFNTIIGSDITGLPATLNNNIILADGQGNIRAQHDGTAWDLKSTVKGVTATAGDNSTNLATTAFVKDAVTTNAVPYTDATKGVDLGAFDLTVNGLTVGKGSGDGTQVNTAVGLNSLKSNTTGTANTALGTNSLKANTVGENNVAMGDTALYMNTTGWYNTAIGSEALKQNTTGASNTAIGNSALYSNTTGGSNIGIGDTALFSNETGGINIAIGSSSLNNTTGTGNIGIGQYALSANTTGNYNTAVGTTSLLSLESGTSNVALGINAGNYVTSGSKNIFIGGQAEGTSTGMTSGSYNTIIGSGITGLPANLNNNIILADGVGNIRAQHDGTAWNLKTTVKGVTELASDNSTNLASTAFVTTAVANAVKPAASFSIYSAQSIDNAGGEYVVLLKNTNFTNMTTPSLIDTNYNNFVAPKAGIYQVNGLITFDSVDTACQSNFKCLIYKNLDTADSFSYDYNTATGAGTGKFSSDPTSDSATIYKSGMPGSSSSSNISCLIELAAGDTLLFGFHVDACAVGSGIQLSANPSKTYFDVNFVSALP